MQKSVTMKCFPLLGLALLLHACKYPGKDAPAVKLSPEAQALLQKDDPFAADTTWSVYRNDRYGYTISYPGTLFDAQPEADLGDGCLFLDKKGNELLRVFGRNNSDPDLGKIYTLREQWAEDTLAFGKESGAVITYRKDNNTFSVFSGTRGGKIYYRKTIKAGNDLAFALFQYPASEKAKYDVVIARMAASFH